MLGAEAAADLSIYSVAEPALSLSPAFPPYGAQKTSTAEVVYVEPVGRLTIAHGSTILVEPAAHCTTLALRPYVLGKALGVALVQRGDLVLHGSAVRVGQRALAVLGRSGQGKSTTAAALVAAGHGLVTDEHVVLRDDRDGTSEMMVCPGFPCIKLRPLDAEACGLQANSVTPAQPLETEHYLRVAGTFDRQPTPLAAIYLLADGPTATPTIEQLNPLDAMFACLRETYGARLMHDLGLHPQTFEQVTNLVSKVPVFRLERRKDRRTIRELAAKITHHFRTSTT